MRLLLDTQLWVWLLSAPERLPDRARKLLEDLSNDVFFSSVSIWEIAIKQRLERRGFSVDAQRIYRELLEMGVQEVRVSSLHGLRTLVLPLRHGDPFDRLLLAQAMEEDLWLLTADVELAGYPGPVLKV